MISIVTGAIVAAVMSIIAGIKRRTAWHWFALSVFVYVAIWFTSFLGLYIADVKIELATPHKELAAFAGVLTCFVIAIVVFAVPSLPRRRGGADRCRNRATGGRAEPKASTAGRLTQRQFSGLAYDAALVAVAP
jgi:hypothetical protein